MIKIKFNSNNKAITLISLIIAIIIMLILTGITLNLTLGKNGLLKKAKEGKEKQVRVEILEELELAKGPIIIENEGVTDLDIYLKTIRNTKLRNKYEITSISYIDDINAEILVDGKYGYTATQKGNDVIINEIGYIKEIIKPEIIIEDEEKWTNDKKNISIITSKYVTKYTTDGTMPSENNGTIYSEPFTVNKNCTIIAAYMDSKNQIIMSTTKEVTKIDKISPTTLDINLTPSKKSIRVKIANAQDGAATNEYGKSEIAEYRYKRDSGAWSAWTTQNEYLFDNIYGDLAGVTCTITVETRDNAGNPKQTSKSAKTTCLNTTYYKDTALNLCVLNQRTYKKANAVPAICAVVYRNAASGDWTGPILVSTQPNGVYYGVTQPGWSATTNSIAGTINYGGTTYYFGGYENSINTTNISTSLSILNTPSTRYIGDRAAYALLDRYFQ